MGKEPPSVISQNAPAAGKLSESIFFHVIIVAAVCFLAYSNTFHVPFQFDDVTRMVQEPYVRDIRQFFDFQGSKWYAGDYAFRMRTAGYFTFALNYWLGGEDVAGYHIVNIVVHTVNALLVYALVVLSLRTPVLREARMQGKGRAIALFSALLFASHPVQTEAVTYIVQRLASLATLFYLLSVVSYARWRLGLSGGSSHFRQLHWYSLSLVSAILAMKTKETAFTLPVVICLYEAMLFRGRAGKRALPLVPLLLTMLIIPAGLIGAGKPLGEVISDASAATRVQSILSRHDYLATELRVIVTYLRLLFFPFGQNFDYDYPLFHSFSDLPVLLSLFLIVLLLGLAVYLVFREKGKASLLRLVSFGIFWFFITLSVESGVVPIADVIFEHRLYLPSAGFFMALAAAGFVGARWLQDKRKVKMNAAVVVVSVAVIVCFSGLAYARNMVWGSEVSLWRDVIKKSPQKARGYNGLGLAYYNLRDYDRAIGEFEMAIALYPEYAVALNNMGNAFLREGIYDRAIDAQTRAIALESGNPIFRFNRGVSYDAMGQYDRAIEDYEKAVALDPSYADAYNNLGVVYHRKGQLPQAIEEYTKAVALNPGNSLYHYDRGLAYASSGRIDLAVADFDDAIALSPGIASFYTNRGFAYAMTGRPEQAAADFGQACERGDENGCRALREIGRRQGTH
jgi:tetratricopeptide (TPR) repeat protein